MNANYPGTQLLKLGSYDLIKVDNMSQRKDVYLFKSTVLFTYR